MQTWGMLMAGIMPALAGIVLVTAGELTHFREGSGAQGCAATAVRLGSLPADACAKHPADPARPGPAVHLLRLNAFTPGEPAHGWVYLGRLDAGGWTPGKTGGEFAGLRITLAEAGAGNQGLRLHWRDTTPAAGARPPPQLDLALALGSAAPGGTPDTAYYLFADRALAPATGSDALRLEPEHLVHASLWARLADPVGAPTRPQEYLTAPATLALLGVPLLGFGLLWQRRRWR